MKTLQDIVSRTERSPVGGCYNLARVSVCVCVVTRLLQVAAVSVMATLWVDVCPSLVPATCLWLAKRVRLQPNSVLKLEVELLWLEQAELMTELEKNVKSSWTMCS